MFRLYRNAGSFIPGPSAPGFMREFFHAIAFKNYVKKDYGADKNIDKK